MAWRSKIPPLKFDVMLSRLVLISIGAFSIWWGLTTFPVFWRDARLDAVADRIMDGEEFKLEILETVLADVDAAGQGPARPEFLRSAAIVQFKLVQMAMGDDNARSPGPLLDRLDAAARRSLAVAPADPYLWLALFFAKIMKDESAPPDFADLRMSYRVGPHEGYVAVLRNYIALRYISDLPPDLAEAAVTEFKDLVASAYFEQAIEILAGPGKAIQDQLQHALGDAPLDARIKFARLADQLGYDLDVPGVSQPEPRPWRWRMQPP